MEKLSKAQQEIMDKLNTGNYVIEYWNNKYTINKYLLNKKGVYTGTNLNSATVHALIRKGYLKSYQTSAIIQYKPTKG